MQTLRDWTIGRAGSAAFARTFARAHARAAIALTAMIGMAVSLAGCSTSVSGAPRLEAQIDDATELSACESAYLTASSGTGSAAAPGASDGRPVMMRYLAARSSADAWTTVAVSCDGRFAEGAMHAAQASYIAQTLASRLGLPALSPASVDYGDVVKLDIPSSSIAAMSLAEDRAGFDIEVLAARKVDGATLAMSDNHKTAAQRLFTISGADTDPRQKVYTVDRLVAHPDTIDDPATGITANTVSVIEMNCAREYLDAIADMGTVSSDADTADGTDGTNSTNATDGTDAASAARASEKTLRFLSQTVTARAWRAFTLGYPATDIALFN